jgi:hypothetical protein
VRQQARERAVSWPGVTITSAATPRKARTFATRTLYAAPATRRGLGSASLG